MVCDGVYVDIVQDREDRGIGEREVDRRACDVRVCSRGKRFTLI